MTAVAAMRGSLAVRMVPKNEPKLVPGDADLLAVDLRPLQQPVHHRRTGVDPVLHRDVDAEQRAFVLARPVDRQDRDAALHPAVVGERDAGLLETVHARNGDHDRQLAAAVAGRQVEPGRDRLALERNRHRLDLVVGEPRVVGEALAFLLVQLDVLLAGIVVGPFGGAVMDRRHVPVVARGDEAALGLGVARLGLAPLGGALERRADIGHLLHAGADRGEIRVGFDAARRGQIDRARLVPVDAVGADDVVERPALLGEALRGRGAVRLGERRVARGGERRARAHDGERAKEAATIHGGVSQYLR